MPALSSSVFPSFSTGDICDGENDRAFTAGSIGYKGSLFGRQVAIIGS